MANSSELTPAQEANLELAQMGLGNWVSGDREAAIAAFADDIEIYVPPELGNAGSYRGIEQFRSWSREWDEAWSEFEMTIGTIEPVGERHIVALIHSRAIGAGSGIEVENSLGWVLGIQEGRMNFLSLQLDLDSARALAAERDSAAN